MERAQRILKKFSKILKEQGAGPLFTTFKGYVTYALYDRWKVRRLRKFPPRMVKNRILFETNDDFTDNCRALFDYKVANGYNKNGISMPAYKDDNVSEIGIGYHTVNYKGKTKTILGVIIRGTNGTIEEWSSNFDMGNPAE